VPLIVLLLLLGVAACTPLSTAGRPPTNWQLAHEVVAGLPSRGQQKWASLTVEQQEEIIRIAEPFLLRWNAQRDPRALAVVLSTFSSAWNAKAPADPVHCTLLDTIVCH
jgi:hypothetical protein